MELGNGGQGRNRTSDTRIFNTTESPVPREKAEEAERVFDRPTEPTPPTEPIPNLGVQGRPSRGLSSRMARAPDHGDRTVSEPGAFSWSLSAPQIGAASHATERYLVISAISEALSFISETASGIAELQLWKDSLIAEAV